MPQIARVFISGNSQAVRLPKEFRLDVAEVDISREGDALILRPRRSTDTPWASLKTAIARNSGPDFVDNEHEQPGQQVRPELDTAFE